MNITIINQFFPPDVSPTGKLAASLAAHRASLGDDVTVITSQGYAAARSEFNLTEDRLRVHRVRTPALAKKTLVRRTVAYVVFFIAAARHVLRLPAQDIVICLTTPPFVELLGLIHKRFHPNTRLVLWCMDCYPEIAERVGVVKPGGFVSRMLRSLNRRTMRRLDHIICLDDAMSQLMQGRHAPANWGTRTRIAPISVVPNWERSKDFASPPSVRDRDPSQPIRILYSGNMGHGHCFDTVIAAAERLRGQGVEFLFTGGGAKVCEIEQAIERLQLNNVQHLGYVSAAELRDLQESADCALITLREDMAGVLSPSKLHANLAMGLPILYVGPAGSNVDTAIVEHGCGVSLRNGDVDGIVSFARRIRSEPLAIVAFRTKVRTAFETEYCDVVSLAKFDRVLGSMTSTTTKLPLSRAA